MMIHQSSDNLLQDLSKRGQEPTSVVEPRSEDEQTTASLLSEDNSSLESNAVEVQSAEVAQKLKQFLKAPISATLGLDLNVTTEQIDVRTHKESANSIAKLSEYEQTRYANEAAAYPTFKIEQFGRSGSFSPVKGVPPSSTTALQKSQDAQQNMQQHTCQQVEKRSTASGQKDPAPQSDLKSLLAQYHEIWSTIDEQEAVQQKNEIEKIERTSTGPVEAENNVIKLADCFSPIDLDSCMQKVSISLAIPVNDDETETLNETKESTICKNFINQFNENQGPSVQLCNKRAHIRDQKSSNNQFMGLLAGGNLVGVGRPHAYSMQQTTASELKGINLNRQGSTNGSPTLQPTTRDQTNLSAFDDVRSLLYCASDSDEIESLVFNQAEHYCIDEEEAEEEQQQQYCDSKSFVKVNAYGFASEDSWSTEHSRHLASAFDYDFSLMHLDRQGAGESQKQRTNYNFGANSISVSIV